MSKIRQETCIINDNGIIIIYKERKESISLSINDDEDNN